MKGDEGCENNDYATLEIQTKIFHDIVKYQTAEGHSIAEISTKGDALQTDRNVNLQTCDMTEKIPIATVAMSRINVERSIVTFNDNIGKVITQGFLDTRFQIGSNNSMDLDEDKNGEQVYAILIEKEHKTECDGNGFIDTASNRF